MVFPTDDDELPEVTGPAWIVDKVAHYGDEVLTETGGQPPVSSTDVAVLLCLLRRLMRRGINAAWYSVASGGIGTGALPLPAGVGDSVRQPVALSDERPSSRFRGIFSPSKDDGCDIPRSA